MTIGMVNSFVVPSTPLIKTARSTASIKMAETYWEGKAPPSKVLGPVLENIPSPALGVVSMIAFGIGTYCVHESNILHTMTVDTIYPKYIVGSLLTPISWGLHVASWINKQNGK
eukprot:CAMPEP_0171462960 /NCGR_PEP_ID=MMETSP0945-20130129/6800_1 /TAXON_ID=109269 /ORGANISM="Vaucheria litorea, Strain CCMP2940" /LENGTH=113 /DNA_ID=CAMNT_0011989613 /DNA_START=82 /DNA_END=423 /DNA_ORIENTATION=+